MSIIPPGVAKHRGQGRWFAGKKGEDDVEVTAREGIGGAFKGRDIHNLGQNFYGEALSGLFPCPLLHLSSAAMQKWRWLAIAGTVLSSKTY